ncbi:MAG TPA: substrate-binding domain-containing protein [Vicinamibacterales bacterium]|nr:substrate-binding domain-containing protein [Vicinamibacterales bacterium]
MIRSAVRHVAASCVLVALAVAAPAAADDVTVMTSGAFTAAYLELAPRFERATGHTLVTATTSMGVGEASIPSRLQRRDAADVVIIEDAALQELAASGLILAGTRVPLARSGIGLAVRAGAPKPDISSLDALRRALLQARSVAYSASVSGRYVSTELFQRLGIAEQMAAKSRRIDRERVGAVVARGEAELGFQQISELLAVPGIDYVGPLPADAQRTSVFSAGVAAHSRNAGPARALIAWLASAEAAPVVARTGLEPFAAQTASVAGAQGAPSGEAAYAKYCAACHDQTAARIPSREALSKMSPARILRTLDFGPMMSVAYPLKRPEREALAAFLGKGTDEPALPPSAMCGPERRILAGNDGTGWSGWSPGPDNARFQPRQRAGLSAADLSRLELKWAFGFPGDVTAFAAPTALRGTLFIGSAAGAVQALDGQTGCVHWQFQANGPVRAAMTIAGDGDTRALVFSDQIGWVYSVDARTGRANWTIRVEAHEATRLTGSFAVHDGLAFVPAASWEETRSIDPAYMCCTFRGSITAVRLRDGSVAWKTYLVDEPKKTGTTAVGTDTFGPSGAGVWSAPTIDTARGVLYVTTGDNYSHPATRTSDAVMALELKTGRVVWTRQTTPGDVYNSACGGRGPNCPAASGPDFDFGSSALLVRAPGGRDVLVAGQKSGVVYGLDPAKRGEVLWQTRVGAGGTNGGVQWGMASDGRRVYAAVSDVGRQPGGIGGAATVGNAQLHPQQGGGLTALNVLDGSKAWFAPGTPCVPPRPGCSPAQPAAVTAIDGAVLSGAMDGHLRAFSSADGTLLWDVDTARRYDTVNGGQGTGGSLDGAGPVVAGGMVFVNSGYPRFGGMPGNVLLAFAPKKQEPKK